MTALARTFYPCRLRWLAAGIAWLLAHIAAPTLAADLAERVRFNEQIRPILSDKCFQCHGPDEKTREADLRLDDRTAAVDFGAIAPGMPEASEILARITTDDPDLRMPPASAKKTPLTAAEIELLRRWIAEGAEYEGHWAFLPLRDDPPPAVQDSDWVRNPIDQFVLARLERAGLAPSRTADRATLIRRVYLDLVGLLPEASEVRRFVDDEDPLAYERMVDRLLASPHYGERWGRYWLDQARYADSNGYSIDGEREMWPYRDWVIQALNEDMPFDQFTVEQLAGDLLPEPSKAQLVASGFHRNTLINQEGGTDREQFRVESVMDRVNTTGAVWLGLTIGCAQCHSHKFDPISQQEYYRFLAFFNSSADVSNVGPTIEVVRGEMFGVPIQTDPPPLAGEALAKRQAAWEAETRRRLEATLPEASATPAEWEPAEYGEATANDVAAFERQDDNSLLTTDQTPAHATYRIELRTALPQVAAIRLRTLTDSSLPQNGPGRAGNGNFVLTNVRLRQAGVERRIARTWADHEQPGYPIADVLDNDGKSGWAINVGPNSTAKMNAPREAIFVLDKPAAEGEALELSLEHGLHATYLIGRFAIELSATAPPLPRGDDDLLLAALRTESSQRSDADKARLQAAFERDEPRARPRDKRSDPNVARPMIMNELASPRPTYLLTRGDFTRPDKDSGPLLPGVPRAIAPSLAVNEAAGSNRLDLARWLVDPRNPMTPRVTMNRVWMRYFGRGLVTTEEDFGTQGTPPTHPDLLDWLGGELIRRGWNMKQMHRLIVTSATYRQDSRPRADLQEIDPRNLLLARQERVRLNAEAVRDAALSASGLLSRTLGGPSVRPPQPDGVYAFTQVAKRWNAEQGGDRYRRALYTFFYRSAPYPLFTTFDAPDFQSVCTRRGRSNTPLQSLTLANDAAFLEMAQGLAVRLLREQTSDASDPWAERIDRAFVLSLCRQPSEVERSTLRGYVERQLAEFDADSDAADKLLSRELRELAAPADGAALVCLARVVLNTDNFITRE